MKLSNPEEPVKIVNTKQEQDEDEILDVDKYIGDLVPTTDDPSIPTFTLRVVILGTFWCVLLAFVNTSNLK